MLKHTTVFAVAVILGVLPMSAFQFGGAERLLYLKYADSFLSITAA